MRATHYFDQPFYFFRRHVLYRAIGMTDDDLWVSQYLVDTHEHGFQWSLQQFVTPWNGAQHTIPVGYEQQVIEACLHD